MTPEEKQQLLRLMAQRAQQSSVQPGQPSPFPYSEPPGLPRPGRVPDEFPSLMDPDARRAALGRVMPEQTIAGRAPERVMPEQAISGNAPQSPAQSMGLSEKQALLRAIQSALSGEQSPDESMLGPRPGEGLFGKMAYHGMEPGRMATGQVQLSPDVVRRAGQNAQMREAAQGAMTSDPQAALSGMSREQLLEMLSRLRQQQ